MKRTNIVLDEDLVAQGMAITGMKTCKALVDKALRDLVRRGKQRRLKDLKGNIEWIGSLDDMRATN